MKKSLLSVFAILVCLSAGAWSRRNHQTVAYIAEQHLTPTAAAKVKELLHGESLVYYAGWMDDFRTIEKIQLPEPDEKGNTEIERAHTFKVNKKFQPTCTPYRDGLWLITDAVENLYNIGSLSDEQKLDYMKVLAHLVGDVHCPCHISYADKRDNKLGKFKVLDTKGNEIAKFHKFLDGTLMDWRFPGGMNDLAYIIDPTLRPACTEDDLQRMRDMQSGSITEWGRETAEECKDIYKKITPDHQMTVEEIQWLADIEKKQILRAGYRLAKILNDLFAE